MIGGVTDGVERFFNVDDLVEFGKRMFTNVLKWLFGNLAERAGIKDLNDFKIEKVPDIVLGVLGVNKINGDLFREILSETLGVTVHHSSGRSCKGW